MSFLQGLAWPDLSWPVLLVAGLAFLLGGLVKGTLGVGLPLVAVPLLSLTMPSPLAISLVAVPVLTSNIWQAVDSQAPITQVRRFWPLLATLLVATVITVPMTLALSAGTLNAMLAIAVLTAVVLMGVNPKLHISARRENICSAVVGAVSGIMGGISSLTGPIIITYLTALGLPRETFVRTISIIYLAGSVPLYVALAIVGRFGFAEFLLSLLAMVPVFAGMVVGKKIRGRLSEVWFRRVLLGFLILIAVLLLFK